MTGITYEDLLKQQTLDEYERLCKHGTRMTLDEYRKACAAIGYRLDTNRRTTCAMGAYTNAHNRVAYLAFGVSYTNLKTGLGYAQVTDDKTNLPALQELRRNAVILHEGRLVET